MTLTEEENRALNNLLAEHRQQINTYKTVIAFLSIIAIIGWLH